MQLETKCHLCVHERNCSMKSSLNDIIQRVIKKTEAAVKTEISSEMEYIIVTDVTVIPTNCPSFMAREKPRQQNLLGSLNKNAFAPA